MIHVRIDDEESNANARFTCGLSWPLPDGDVYFFASEPGSRYSDCPGCNPGGPLPYGTPIGELSGRPGAKGYEEFKRISDSWGYP